MNLNIVGAGFSGCITALNQKNLFDNINIFDYKNNIGGILNEIEFNDSFFLNGCQYLDVNTEWFKTLLSTNLFNFHEFNHSYSSYTNLEGYVNSSNNVAGPIFDINNFDLKLFKKKNTINSSIKENFDQYPESIKKLLSKWFNNFKLNDKQIHFLSLQSIQLSRVFFNKNNNEIFNLKNNYKFLDDIIGVPRSFYTNKPLKAAIPFNGYNKFFKNLKNYLEDNHVKFYLRSNIKLLKGVDDYYFNNEKLKSNQLTLWAANPVPLISTLNLGKIQNPFIKVNLYHFNIISNVNSFDLFKYIQVYSLEDPILRIYIYELDNHPKIVVEAFQTADIGQINYSLNKILEHFNINIDYKFIFTSLQIRHIFYTIEDKKIFDKFSSNNSQIIPGAWDSYSRNDKIEKIGKNIEKIR